VNYAADDLPGIRVERPYRKQPKPWQSPHASVFVSKGAYLAQSHAPGFRIEGRASDRSSYLANLSEPRSR
jgi:hypothetical protein